METAIGGEENGARWRDDRLYAADLSIAMRTMSDINPVIGKG